MGDHGGPPLCTTTCGLHCHCLKAWQDQCSQSERQQHNSTWIPATLQAVVPNHTQSESPHYVDCAAKGVRRWSCETIVRLGRSPPRETGTRIFKHSKLPVLLNSGSDMGNGAKRVRHRVESSKKHSVCMRSQVTVVSARTLSTTRCLKEPLPQLPLQGTVQVRGVISSAPAAEQLRSDNSRISHFKLTSS